jgi:hypothetical protein
MNAYRISAISEFWRNTGNGIALRLSFNDLNNPKLENTMQSRLLKLVAKPSECVLILDFAEAEISDVDAFATFAFEWIVRLLSYGQWRRVIFQATNYPEKNPAAVNRNAFVKRAEWLIWQRIVELDAKMQEHATFGDFGTDHAKFDFGPGGIPIKHFRYARTADWFVCRGGEASDPDDIRTVAMRLVDSGAFAGSEFSSGDHFMACCADGSGRPGNPSDWRAANMTHHITRVVVDLSDLYSRRLVRPKRTRAAQQSLFHSEGLR